MDNSPLYNYFATAWTYKKMDAAKIDAAVTKGYLTEEEGIAIKELPQQG